MWGFMQIVTSILISFLIPAIASTQGTNEKAPPKRGRNTPLIKNQPVSDPQGLYQKAMDLLAKKDETASQTEAIPLLTQAAERGHIASQLQLGNCYRDGFGTTKNCDESLKWYLKAAEGGDAVAQRNLAGEAGKCPGIQDARERSKWLKRSAEQGNEEACLVLAAAYKAGSGVPISIPDAYIWYSITAALSGQYKDLATFMRDQTAKELTQTTREHAQEQSQKHFEEILVRIGKK